MRRGAVLGFAILAAAVFSPAAYRDAGAGEGRSSESVMVSTMGFASVDDLLGREVCDRQGNRLAHIGGVLLDKNAVAYLILYLPGPGGVWNCVPVPSNLAEFLPGHPVTVDIEKRSLYDAPGYAGAESPDFRDLDWERQIHSYYGEKPPERGRDSYILIRR